MEEGKKSQADNEGQQGKTEKMQADHVQLGAWDEKGTESQENSRAFTVGDVRVHLRFTEDGPSLEELLKNYFLSLKQG